jgi:hypothetical protein
MYYGRIVVKILYTTAPIIKIVVGKSTGYRPTLKPLRREEYEGERGQRGRGKSVCLPMSLKFDGKSNWKAFYAKFSRGLWNIFHKKLMITSIAEFSHSNRTTASRPS